MKKIFLFLTTLLIFCFNWAGCGSDKTDEFENVGGGNNVTPSYSITLSKNELEFDSNTGYQTVSLTCSNKWEVSGGSDWCDISHSSGSGNQTLTVTVDENPKDEDRTVTFTFSCGNQTTKLTVIQYGIVNTSYVELNLDKEDTEFTYNPNTGETVIVYPDDSVPTVEEGQAFVLTAEYEYDIRKITSVDSSKGKLVLQTEQGSMCDLFRNISFTLTTNPDLVADSRSTGRVITPATITLVNDNQHTVIYDKNADDSRNAYDVTKKIFDFKQDFSGASLIAENNKSGKWELKWEKWKTDIGLHGVFFFDFGENANKDTKVGELKNFKYYLQGNVDVDLLLNLGVESEGLEYEVDETIKKNVIPKLTFTFMAGPVPVPISLEVDFNRFGNVSAKNNLSASAGFKLHADAKLGMEYNLKDKTSAPITSFNGSFETYEPYYNIKGNVEATAGAYPELEFHFYKCIGPSIKLKPLYTAQITAGLNHEYWGWDAAFGTKLVTEAGIEFEWGKIGNKDIEWTLNIMEMELAQSTLIKTPQTIELENPTDTDVELDEEVEVAFHVQGRNMLTNDTFNCPSALVQFETTGNIKQNFAIADKEGIVKVKYTPSSKEDKLIAKVIDSEGEVIDQVEFIPTVEEETNDVKALLRTIYDQLDGENWNLPEEYKWFGDKPIEYWEGVYFDSFGNFHGIDLSTLEINSSKEYNLKIPKNRIMKSINLGDFKIKSLDASRCKGLETIGGSNISSLDVSGCTALESLYYRDMDQLVSLDASGCTALDNIACINNQLTSLNVSGCTALRELYCINNPLTSLDVSGCTALERLDCSNNQLTSLNVSGCTALGDINCSNNQLTSLNVSGCTALGDINCSNNQFATLDLSESTSLSILLCHNNPLTTLDLSGCNALDDLFLKNINTTSLKIIGKSLARGIVLHESSISSLELSGFTVIGHVDLENINSTSLKVKSSVLNTLFIGDSEISSLNISNCTSIESVSSENNSQLRVLDASGCNALKYLNFYNQNSTSLKVNSSALDYIDIRDSEISSLDFSNCKSVDNVYFGNDNGLSKLGISGGKIKKLNLSINSNSLKVSGNSSDIEEMWIHGEISSLDLSNCTSVKYINYPFSTTETLDVSRCKSLESLECGEALTSLNVSGCTALKRLSCVQIPLTSLNLSGCTALESLECDNIPLTSLNLSGLKSLKGLSCGETPLTSLNVSGCTALESLQCYKTQLTSLDVSGCKNLESLSCGSNQLTSLDVSGCKNLESLSCGSNQLTSLDVSKCTSLKEIDCHKNQLVSLNASGCTALKDLYCEDNAITREIPDWFSQLRTFKHDVRYTYSTYKNSQGEEITTHTDNGFGWWYPGEPAKGEHSPD